MTLTPGHYTIQTVGRGDMLTMNPIDSTAVFRRISGDLKTDSYDENAFKLWVDTAAYDSNQALNVPTYFILKDAKYTDGTSILTGNFLYGSHWVILLNLWKQDVKLPKILYYFIRFPISIIM